MSQSLIQLIQHRLRPDPVARFHRIKFIPLILKKKQAEEQKRTEENRRVKKKTTYVDITGNKHVRCGPHYPSFTKQSKTTSATSSYSYVL